MLKYQRPLRSGSWVAAFSKNSGSWIAAFSKLLVLGCNLPLVGEGYDSCGSMNDLCTLVPGLIFKGTTGYIVQSH